MNVRARAFDSPEGKPSTTNQTDASANVRKTLDTTAGSSPLVKNRRLDPWLLGGCVFLCVCLRIVLRGGKQTAQEQPRND